MKTVVLDAGTFHFDSPEPWAFLQTLGEVELHTLTPYADEEIVNLCRGAEFVLTNKVPLSQAVLEQLPELKCISVLATGYNIIDLDAAREAGVTVCNVPGYSTACVVQHTLALMLELCNHVGSLSQTVHAGDWVRSPLFSYWPKPLIELQGLTVGIIGYGEIGGQVGDVVHALGAEVLGYRRSRRDGPSWDGFAWAEVEEICERADIISLHCPQTPDNAKFINADFLRRMKPTAMLVNTARGGLIDEAALADALRRGEIAGAALDVVTHEPMREDCPLLGVENCLITPHVAWSGLPSRMRLLDTTEANLRAYLAGKPQNVVS